MLYSLCSENNIREMVSVKNNYQSTVKIYIWTYILHIDVLILSDKEYFLCLMILSVNAMSLLLNVNYL